MDKIIQIDINKTHPLFASIKIKVDAQDLQIKASTSAIALTCVVKYYDAQDVDITNTFAPKVVQLITTNNDSTTLPDGTTMGTYDYLIMLLSKPVAVTSIIQQYVVKNIDKFI